MTIQPDSISRVIAEEADFSAPPKGRGENARNFHADADGSISGKCSVKINDFPVCQVNIARVRALCVAADLNILLNGECSTVSTIDINTAAAALRFIAADGHSIKAEVAGIHEDTAAIPGVIAAGDDAPADTIGKGQAAVHGDHIAVIHRRGTRKAAVNAVPVQVNRYPRGAGFGRQRTVIRACGRVTRQGNGSLPGVQFGLHPLPDREDFRVKGDVPAHGVDIKVPRGSIGIFLIPAGQDISFRHGIGGSCYLFTRDNFLLLRRGADPGGIKAHRVSPDKLRFAVPVQPDSVIRVITEKDSRVRLGKSSAVVRVFCSCEHTAPPFHADADGACLPGEGCGNPDDTTVWQLYI